MNNNFRLMDGVEVRYFIPFLYIETSERAWDQCPVQTRNKHSIKRIPQDGGKCQEKM